MPAPSKKGLLATALPFGHVVVPALTIGYKGLAAVARRAYVTVVSRNRLECDTSPRASSWSVGERQAIWVPFQFQVVNHDALRTVTFRDLDVRMHWWTPKNKRATALVPWNRLPYGSQVIGSGFSPWTDCILVGELPSNDECKRIKVRFDIVGTMQHPTISVPIEQFNGTDQESRHQETVLVHHYEVTANDDFDRCAVRAVATFGWWIAFEGTWAEMADYLLGIELHRDTIPVSILGPKGDLSVTVLSDDLPSRYGLDCALIKAGVLSVNLHSVEPPIPQWGR